MRSRMPARSSFMTTMSPASSAAVTRSDSVDWGLVNASRRIFRAFFGHSHGGVSLSVLTFILYSRYLPLELPKAHWNVARREAQAELHGVRPRIVIVEIRALI